MRTKAKRRLSLAIAIAVALWVSGCASTPNAQRGMVPTYDVTPELQSSTPLSADLADSIWPRYVANGATTNIIYQPQVDSWDGQQLVARNAVALITPELPRALYGAVTIRATTLVNKTTRMVALENIQVLNGDFPSARDKSKEYVRLVQQTFPKEIQGLSLDRLEASFAVAPQKLKSSSGTLNNTPPRIIFAKQPAILVYIDGPPTYKPVTGTELERVINTGMLLFKDQSGQYFLRVSDGYMSAPALAGPWKTEIQLPNGTAEAERDFRVSSSPDLVAPQSVAPSVNQTSASSRPTPLIYVATTPTELVIFEGEPNFVPIAATHLLYAANTTANVFKLLSDQRTYVLLSGRWFRAASLEGPWEYVPATELAKDFEDIPDASPKENVKANVPGTQQATEALVANSIPQSTKVRRDAQMRDPHIHSAAQLQSIAGTSLFFVANSDTPIIKVDENSWYACQDGVWFASTSINGPWTVASYVPPVIYSIPPSSPLRYVTYVRIYGSQPDYVYEGYTPGYFGAEVEDGVVVYGTGYYYAPWVGGGVWYGYPITWGFGWGPCWTPWYDWCFGFGFGWGYGYGAYAWHHCHPPAPWWGPYHHGSHEPATLTTRHLDRITTAGNVYPHSGLRGGGDPRPNNGSEIVGNSRAFNSRTGAPVAGQGRVPEMFEGSAARSGLSGRQSSVTPGSHGIVRTGPGTLSGSVNRNGFVAPRNASGSTFSNSGSRSRQGGFGGNGFNHSSGARGDAGAHGSAHGTGSSRGGTTGGGHSAGGGGHSGGGSGGSGHGGSGGRR